MYKRQEDVFPDNLFYSFYYYSWQAVLAYQSSLEQLASKEFAPKIDILMSKLWLPSVEEIAKSAKPVNGQDERHINVPPLTVPPVFADRQSRRESPKMASRPFQFWEKNLSAFSLSLIHICCCIDALRVIRELNARSSGLKKYDVYEKAITRQRRELELSLIHI